MLLHIWNRATGPARKLRGGTTLSRWLLQAGEPKSGRSSVHGKSSGALYPFWLGFVRTGSFVKLTTWSGPAGQGHPLPNQNNG